MKDENECFNICSINIPFQKKSVWAVDLVMCFNFDILHPSLANADGP